MVISKASTRFSFSFLFFPFLIFPGDITDFFLSLLPFERSFKIIQHMVIIPQGQHHISSAQQSWGSCLDGLPNTKIPCCNNFFSFFIFFPSLSKAAELPVLCNVFFFLFINYFVQINLPCPYSSLKYLFIILYK